MEAKRVTDKYGGDNIEIKANEANDVRLILSALHVYRNQLDTQRALDRGLRNGSPNPAADSPILREISGIDAMTDMLSKPQPLPEVEVISPLAS
jgi:hypothetical protein